MSEFDTFTGTHTTAQVRTIEPTKMSHCLRCAVLIGKRDRLRIHSDGSSRRLDVQEIQGETRGYFCPRFKCVNDWLNMSEEGRVALIEAARVKESHRLAKIEANLVAEGSLRAFAVEKAQGPWPARIDRVLAMAEAEGWFSGHDELSRFRGRLVVAIEGAVVAGEHVPLKPRPSRRTSMEQAASNANSENNSK